MAKSQKTTTAAAADEMMTIAFPNGGILPTEITGGEEITVAAHKSVEVPKSYGLHLVQDRFAYIPDADGEKGTDKLSDADRKALQQKLAGLREDLKKATTEADKAKLAAAIDEIETQLAAA